MVVAATPLSKIDAPAELRALEPMIGSTPLIELRYRSRGEHRTIYAKYEQKNMTGSVKDRMALWIMARAYESGALHPGDTIAEATSGNTGIAFAAIGKALGHPIRIFMPDWMSRERVALIRSFGAEIVPVSTEQHGFLGSIELADRFAEQYEGRVFLPHQFDNPSNCEAHTFTTGPEIVRQLELIGRKCEAFIAGVGTGGTVMGVGRYLRDLAPTRVHPLEPANSPTLRTGCRVGSHRIQGISDEFVPSIVHLDELDEIVDVWDGDAIIMAQELARVGLAVGISSGANFLGADKLLDETGADACVVTIFCDSNKKYLSTSLCEQETALPEYRSPEIQLLSWRAIGMPG